MRPMKNDAIKEIYTTWEICKKKLVCSTFTQFRHRFALAPETRGSHEDSAYDFAAQVEAQQQDRQAAPTARF